MAYTSLVYRGSQVSTTDASSYTFSACDIGAANTWRAVHLNVHIDAANFAAMTTVTATIGGVSATLVATAGYSSAGNHVRMFVARVPTGTTADIVLSLSNTAVNIAISWYTFNPISLTAVDSLGMGANASTAVLADLEVVNGGVAFCATQCSGSGNTPSYSGIDSPVVDLASTFVENPGTASYVAAFHVVTNESITTNDIGYTGGFATRIVAAVSYGAERVAISETVSETVNVSSVDAPKTTYVSTLTDNGMFVDEPYYRDPISYSDSVSDGLTVSLTALLASSGSLTDTVRVVDLVVPGYAVTVRDVVRASESTLISPVCNVTESVGIENTYSLAYRLGPVLSDSARVQDAVAAACKFVVIVTESKGFTESFNVAVPVTLAESVAIQLASSVVRAITVMERLGLNVAALMKATYGKTVFERVQLRDLIGNFFGADLADGLSFGISVAAKKVATPTLTSAVSVGDTITPKFFIRAIAADTVRLTDAQILKMLFKPQLAETVELTAAYLSPGGGFTAWAINTKTAAVTEYSNYEFNSFAQAGHKYLGASSSGLYELNGDNDAGTNIIAQIKSGFAQFGGSRFTSFKAAYLGMRGDGDFVLKIVTGDGKTYNYAVVGKDMETTKVHMGKGLRARYFAFELISTGQDFDLDDIEFMPLVAQRRV